ncbi:uncharacterized protein N7484_010042 [Penicillium longicatenatum]|uniref:uncharacterized protein n=1 Tax=Penicillium longicatenatum TaxID=1561947 RepID=UPI0025495010|nr:uncharacterized protein N7484_010042 [Penicillium longicatenatum]KAJ5636729.1 hypothetical protein N7484_010042 [Penicillium longicatenatum]
MAVVLSLLVQAVLVAIPIGGSLGVLFGIDAYRSNHGQAALFSGDTDGNGSGGSTGSGGSSATNNGVNHSIYCQLSYGITPSTTGEQFTLNPNQWGVTDSTSGALCMNVTTFNNETYPTKTTAPEFSITWQFDPGPETAPVHAFPNIMVDDVLPIALDKMTKIAMDFRWTYGVGDTPVENTNTSDLTANSVNVNVAVDMFFDSDKTAAQNSTKAKYEVMVWFARIGDATQPNGNQTSTSRKVGDTTFDLWSGTNDVNQNVLTWVASEVTGTFNGDLYPLITDLYELSGDDYPSSTDYMGIFSYGSEVFSSDKNVTFWSPKLSIDIQK